MSVSTSDAGPRLWYPCLSPSSPITQRLVGVIARTATWSLVSIASWSLGSFFLGILTCTKKRKTGLPFGAFNLAALVLSKEGTINHENVPGTTFETLPQERARGNTTDWTSPVQRSTRAADTFCVEVPVLRDCQHSVTMSGSLCWERHFRAIAIWSVRFMAWEWTWCSTIHTEG